MTSITDEEYENEITRLNTLIYETPASEPTKIVELVIKLQRFNDQHLIAPLYARNASLQDLRGADTRGPYFKVMEFLVRRMDTCTDQALRSNLMQKVEAFKALNNRLFSLAPDPLTTLNCQNYYPKLNQALRDRVFITRTKPAVTTTAAVCTSLICRSPRSQ